MFTWTIRRGCFFLLLVVYTWPAWTRTQNKTWTKRQKTQRPRTSKWRMNETKQRMKQSNPIRHHVCVSLDERQATIHASLIVIIYDFQRQNNANPSIKRNEYLCQKSSQTTSPHISCIECLIIYICFWHLFFLWCMFCVLASLRSCQCLLMGLFS